MKHYSVVDDGCDKEYLLVQQFSHAHNSQNQALNARGLNSNYSLFFLYNYIL